MSMIDYYLNEIHVNLSFYMLLQLLLYISVISSPSELSKDNYYYCNLALFSSSFCLGKTVSVFSFISYYLGSIDEVDGRLMEADLVTCIEV